VTTSAVSPPPPPADLDEALTRIRASGGRVTRAKRTVVGLLFDAADPLTAEEITERSGLDQSVVYRSLAQFEELGIAEHVHVGHGRAVYRRRGLPTVPVTCVGCGRTVELPVADVRAFARRVADRTGIALDLVHFPLSGYCSDCAAAAGS
jgi:Fur family ferric uptake transcriptional regulator